MELRINTYRHRFVRKAMNFCSNHKTINQTLTKFGQITSCIFDRYTCGLSRESYRLWQNCQPTDSIEIKDQSFYVNGKKSFESIQLANRLRSAGVSGFILEGLDFTPEAIARSFRQIIQSESIGMTLGQSAIPFTSVLISDQISKHLAQSLNLPFVEHWAKPNLGIIYIKIILSLLLIGENAPNQFQKIGIGLALGGAVSNQLDLFTKGYVLDYLFSSYGVSNLADHCIALGLTSFLLGHCWKAVQKPTSFAYYFYPIAAAICIQRYITLCWL